MRVVQYQKNARRAHERDTYKTMGTAQEQQDQKRRAREHENARIAQEREDGENITRTTQKQEDPRED